MTLSAVHLSSHVYMVCVSHAFTTEKEEIMGLLLGDILKEVSPVTKTRVEVAHIWGLSVLSRSDKRKDRVEISPEQLALVASTEAEQLSEQLGRTARVVGWYHSHPHITVHPSHVDVRTQASYQMLDSGFVGLIFSCFNKDETSKVGRVQVTAFQAAKDKGVEIPIYIVPPPLNAPNLFDKLVTLQRILTDEEKTSYKDSFSLVPQSQREHPLLQLHNISVYQKSMCRFVALHLLLLR
eukprot:TRINITY_DN6963_c0_g1_i3.p1 TRINITY_DN6963_c0_g1~~TRINITY_DN6963_c0_g1_i3.p1  ORF type:complete len:238 (-),score=42.78 TRINITY_DN6963_c0_g1_i3:53-766(-)